MATKLRDSLAKRYGPRSWAQERAYRLKQALAGAVEATVANSSQTPGSYRPALLDQPGALAGVITSLVTRRADGQPTDGSNIVERHINNALTRAGLASERTNSMLGIRAPKTTRELALRMAGGFVVPSPKGSQVASVLNKSRAGAKAVTVAKRVAAATPKPLRTAARVATEIAVPLRQTGSKHIVAPTVATGALGTGMDYVMEQAAPEYESAVFDPAAPVEEEAQIDDIDQLALDIAAPETDDLDEFAMQAIEQPDDAAIDEAEEQDKLLTWDNAGIALGTVLGGAAIARFAPGMARTALNGGINELPRHTGKQYRASRGSVAQKLKQKFIQQDEPLRSAIDEFATPAQASRYKDAADRVNNVAIGARIADFLQTGRMPKLNMRGVKLAPTMEAYAKELSIDEQRAVSDALLAQSALDDIDRTGVQAALKVDRDGNPVTAAQLRAQVLAARNNPKYAKYMDAVQQGYRDLLKFRVARGMLTPEKAVELSAKRPNYVRMKRDLETEVPPDGANPFNANKHRMSENFERSSEEGRGVTGVTGVGNPFNTLLDDWASEIRRAEVNDLRLNWLEDMANNSPLVERIPNGVKPLTQEGIHVVRKNGVDISFKVKDDVMSKALEFSPRASWKGLEMWRQFVQNTVTGPLGTAVNLFGFLKSPVYDTTMGMLLKPDNVHLGLVNELLSKVNSNASIGRLDITALGSAFTGAARYAWDDMRGAIAQNLTDQLTRDNTWLRTAIGDNNVKSLRDTMEQAYENSIKSFMDQEGITSHTLHGTPDPSEVMGGLSTITPKFSSDMAEALARDTMEARAKGQVSPITSLLKRDAAGFAALRAGAIGRVYGGLLEAMHNGFRYSAVAANKNRIPNSDALAAMARRISVDSAQHGGHENFNKAVGSLAYANLSIQSMFAVGQQIKQNPLQFMGNLTSVALPLVAMHYLALATDPKAKEAHEVKSATQKANSVTTFGGAEIPVDPIMRLMLAPTMAVLDHVTGAHDGNWNGDILRAFNTWLDGSAEGEEMDQDWDDVIKEAVKANNPVALEAIPIAGAALAYNGIDPGMTRMSDEAAPVRTQQQTGTDIDQKRPDSLTSAWAENLIVSLFGSVGNATMNIANDAHRAFLGSNSVGKAIEVGVSRYKDGIAKGSGVAKPLLFDGYENVQSSTDTNWKLIKEREAGIEQANTIFSKDLKAGGDLTSQDRRKRDYIPDDAPQMDEKILGTENQIIAGIANRLTRNRQYMSIQAELSNIAKQVEGIRNGYVTPTEERNKAINELNEKRRAMNTLKITLIRTHEEQIAQMLGRKSFKFDTYNPDDYMGPIPGSQPQ